jgi:hypothetical protein
VDGSPASSITVPVLSDELSAAHSTVFVLFEIVPAL